MAKEIHSIPSSKMSQSSESTCRILDDAELETKSAFREWREDKQVLSAKRIFGSPGTGPRAFPKAFQNYKPVGTRAPTTPLITKADHELIQSVRQLLKLTPLLDVSGCTIRPSTPLNVESHASLPNETRLE